MIVINKAFFTLPFGTHFITKTEVITVIKLSSTQNTFPTPKVDCYNLLLTLFGRNKRLFAPI